MKQVVIIYENSKPVMCCELKNVADSTEFLKLKAECEKNLLELKAKEQEKMNHIANLEKRLLKAETELAYNRGEITEKEYERVCGIK